MVRVATVVPFCDSVTNAPFALPAGLTVPEMLPVEATMLKTGTVAGLPFTVTLWLAGVNVNPASVGVTV
jgi:hypothetical protein